MTPSPDHSEPSPGPDRASGAGVAWPPDGRLSVCFVCTGNICRSPMAAAVLTRLAEDHRLGNGTVLGHRLVIGSAGTGGWHAGDPIDRRAGAALQRRGYDGQGHRARAFESVWFTSTDLLVCLDRGHQQTLLSLARNRAGDDRYEQRVVLLRHFDRSAGADVDVPDPYYGDDGDFERCLDLVEGGCRGLVPHLAGLLGQGRAKETNDSRS